MRERKTLYQQGFWQDEKGSYGIQFSNPFPIFTEEK